MTSSHQERTVGAVLRTGAAKTPNAPAIVCEGETLGYGELLERAELCGARLGGLGLEPGDRVLLMLNSDLSMVEAWLGCALQGLVEVPINTEFQGEMLRYVITDSGASTIVTDPEFLDRILSVLGEAPAVSDIVVAVGDALPDPAMPAGVSLTLLSDLEPAEPREPDAVAEQDPIGVLYTSGTTGPAKGTLISHRHAFEYASANVDMLNLQPSDIYYAPMPLFHIAGQWALLYAGLIAGSTVAIRRRFSTSEFWVDCRRLGVTATGLLGSMAQFLHGQPATADDTKHSVKRMSMVPLVDDLEGFKHRFGVEVITCYGSTETGLPLISDFDVSDPTVAGRPRDGYELRLVDEDDEEVPVGEVGELCLRHREPWTTMMEYSGKPEATAHAFRNQWLHSGDALRVDADGAFHFVDRIGDTLRRRGENISSFEVEREVYAHDAVLECAAIGIPSEYTEEDLALIVVPKTGTEIDAEELRGFLAARAPKFMVPDLIDIRTAMPKTPTGKIQKAILRTEVSPK